MLGIDDELSAFCSVLFGLADAAMTPPPSFLTTPANF